MSSLWGEAIEGKRCLQDRDDFGGVIDRQRRLRHEGKAGRVARGEAARVLGRLDQVHAAVWRLAHCADDFRVAGMTDQDDLLASLRVALGLNMDFRDERTGGVDIDHVAALSLCRDGFRHAVGRKHDRAVFRALIEFLDEHRAQSLETLHNVRIVDDFVAYIDGRAPFAERLFDDLDRPVHARTEAARGS